MDKGNNNVENLEYVTRKQNMVHAGTNGAFAEHNPYSAKLTESQVLEIREAYAKGGVGYGALAERFCVDKSNIAAIVKRRSWRWI